MSRIAGCIKTSRWILLLCLLQSACNRVTDIQPDQSDEIPASVIQAVVDQFPQAKGMLFKTLEKNRVWQVNFNDRSARISAATNQQMLLVAYELNDQPVPDSLTSLVRNTVIDGGTFSNLRVQNYSWFKDASNNGQFILADYNWQGKPYTVRWNVTNINGNITYVTELLPYNQLEYRTVTLDDLPSSIQESLKNQPVDFNYALVQVDQQTQKRYNLTVQQNTSFLTLTYNDEGVLVAALDPQQTQTFGSLAQLPQTIRTYVRNTPELTGFDLGGQFTLLSKSQYKGVETYTVNLQKGRETWFMTFNSQGELITRSYLNLV